MVEYPSFEPKGDLRQRAEAFLASGESHVVEPRLASTVMLLLRREGKREPLVFMMRRAATMDFAPDAVVFPGGGVSAGDCQQPERWLGPSLAEWASALHRDDRTACSILMAAARELFEECGILLASRDGRSLSAEEVAGLQAGREGLVKHEISFADFLNRHGLAFRSDLLFARSNVVTPRFSPRRYDTFFFSAMLPNGQVPDGKTSESVRSDWVDPAQVIFEADRGALHLLPVTKYNLELIIESGDCSGCLGVGDVGRTIRPDAYFNEDGVLIIGPT